MKQRHELYSVLPDLTDIRIKRLAKANLYGVVILCLNAVGWGVAHTAMGFYPLAVVSFSYLLYAYLIYRLNSKGRYFWGIGLTLFGASAWITLVAFYISGPGWGYGGAVHANFLVLAFVSYYLLGGLSKTMQYSLTISMLLLFLFFQFSPIYFEPLIVLSSERKFVAGLVTWIFVAVMIVLFSYWISSELVNYEKLLSYSNRALPGLLKTRIPENILARISGYKDISVKIFAESTVILMDIKNLEALSKAHSMSELTQLLNHFFEELDDTLADFGLEKLTKKDYAYAAVAKFSVNSQEHADQAVRFAVKVNQIAARYPHLEVSFGICSGAFNAIIFSNIGVIQDIWGDAVTHASLLEKQAPQHAIKVSRTVYLAVKNKFDCKAGEDFDGEHGQQRYYLITGS